MEVAALPCSPERNGAGAGGEGSAAPERAGAGRVESVVKESNGARGVESVVKESNGAGGAAPQIQEGKVDGRTCHQCRQKRTHFAAACMKIKKTGLCSLKYCQNCLLNRYGEVAEAVAQEESWTCPKCRGECNCSMCRKKNGETPTGILAHAAKASGFSSVHDLLNKGPDVVAAAQKLVTPLKVNGTLKGNPKSALGRDDVIDEWSAEGDDLNGVSSVPASKKVKVNSRVNSSPVEEKSVLRNESPDAQENEIVLPKGTPVTSIAGADLEAEDVGPAIQFYEFCCSFAEIFQIRKGQPEKILQDIYGGRELRVVSSLIAELHINLLSVIKEDKGKRPLNYSRDGDKWIVEIGKYISESTFISKEVPLDCFNQGALGYKNLSPSCKLHVLNFLCDETLSSAKLRNWMDKQNERAAERKSAAREKIRAANEKEKELKERQSGIAKAKLLREGEETPSIEETHNLGSQIKEAKEAKQAAVNALEEEVDCVYRTKLVMVDKGAAYWKLDGYCNNTTIMRQEFDNEYTMGNRDKWFMFTEDEEKVIADYVATWSRSRWIHTRVSQSLGVSTG